MRIEGTHVGPNAADYNRRERPIATVTPAARLIELLIYPAASGNMSTAIWFDENHAQALVLALQAAIAEVQARAVSL